jgi:hypothetical protein
MGMCIGKMMWIKMGNERLTEGNIYDINVAYERVVRKSPEKKDKSKKG